MTTRKSGRWALQDAKNRLSEVVDAAVRGQPQVVTRRGVETVVIISRDAYARLAAVQSDKRPSLVEYLLDGPAVEGGEAFERIKLRPRTRA